MILSEFQKISIKALEDGKHSLVMAGTGSGKTLPAEFAIKFFTDQGRKVIYTSPIKALSNQKYYDLSQKFPEVSFGLITGDIKRNANADVLIMTCEILRNNLYNNNENYHNKFDVSIDEIGCIVFDEIHYINDKDRGHVWEECLIKIGTLNDTLEKPIQILMLSATMSSPEIFAKYIENMSTKKIEVVMSLFKNRIVPLEHYSLMFIKDSVYKKYVKESERPSFMSDLNSITNISTETHFRKILLKTEESVYKDNINYCRKIINDYNRQDSLGSEYIVNKVAMFLQHSELLPAIYFVLSRKRVVANALKVQISLNTEALDNEVINTANSIMRKLPNHKEYTDLPEYRKLLGCLEKGVAYHHAGMLPVFRELVEMMFLKGYVKLLFATETFSVGINLPTKATVFDSIDKHDEDGTRTLHAYEYMQMAGRAGRRSIDSIGYVFHVQYYSDSLINVFSGSFPRFDSKMIYNYDFIFRIIASSKYVKDLQTYVQKTFIYKQYIEYINVIKEKHDKLSLMINNDVISIYNNNCKNLSKNISTNQKKKILKELKELEDKYPTDIKNEEQRILYKQELERGSIDDLINETVSSMISNGYLEEKSSSEESFKDSSYGLTMKGLICSSIQEVDGIMFTEEFYKNNCFKDLSEIEIIEKIYTLLENPDKDSSRTPDVSLESIKNWILATNEEECLTIIHSEVFTGTLIKVLLKINNTAKELSSVIEPIEEFNELNYRLKKIPGLLLKHVCTMQSLYL